MDGNLFLSKYNTEYILEASSKTAPTDGRTMCNLGVICLDFDNPVRIPEWPDSLVFNWLLLDFSSPHNNSR